ncbi:hypothetical protein [Algiphilus sp.]|uniref:hypothetical protein n=1 Tax=Algiphilus sp. TaxID=1872431 RepID=UPI0025BBD94D|nr:hypothetical protein [Algiphilus sp.]MCK5772025.1 hypothetical protein [Algiphilus sp.]
MTGNPQRPQTRFPCNRHAVDRLLDAADVTLQLDEAGAGVVGAHLSPHGVTLILQQAPPAHLGLSVYDGVRSTHDGHGLRSQWVGRALLRGVMLEWRSAAPVPTHAVTLGVAS